MTTQSRQIIAMGGGGFSEEPDNLALDRYILQQARSPNPIVCFVPTASGDSDTYIVRFYAAFSTLPCRARHLSLFRQPRDMDSFVSDCDVIYVGGGNTRNMLAIWRSCQFDTVLRRAWESGTVLCGVSAGAICWFEQGHTDSAGSLGAMECLGFLSGSCTPHYDVEPQRRPSYHALMKNGDMSAGYALDDGAALHFIDASVAHAVTSRPAARALRVQCESGTVTEESLQTRCLISHNPPNKAPEPTSHSVTPRATERASQ
jgi:dipeptidase E